MPTPRQHTDQAARQKAYRARQQQGRAAQLVAKGLPPAPPIPAMPGERRWAQMFAQAKDLVENAQIEMQEYWDERSEAWQEGERGEAMQERLDQIDTLLSDWPEA